jgi:superfamily II RNA helicase
MELTEADEGEMVRYFRMVIQLLRELMHAPHTSDKLKAAAGSAWHKINRGVVDAERQLRV